jgi:hypothetical protein
MVRQERSGAAQLIEIAQEERADLVVTGNLLFGLKFFGQAPLLSSRLRSADRVNG